MSMPLSGNSTSASAAAIALAASLASNAGVGGGTKRRFADPEYIAMSEFLNTVGEVDDQDPNNVNANANHSSTSGGGGMNGAAQQQKRARTATTGAPYRPAPHENVRRDQLVPATKNREPHRGRAAPNGARTHSDAAAERLASIDNNAQGDEDFDDNQSDKSDKSGSGRHAASRHTKLTELEARVRGLERDNLHLKQTLLLGKNGSAMIAGRGSRENTQRLLSERTKVVTEMVEQLNASFLTIGDASRVWHQDCRIGVGVREWDAFGRLETISLWNMIRSVFATIAVDIVELRPHLPDGEMILTKWRIQGEIASPAQLEAVCSSEDCPATMKVALMAIKSSDLTFTVTTYVIFQDALIAEQHHCWDQVGVFKRLFGGEIPPSVQEILRI